MDGQIPAPYSRVTAVASQWESIQPGWQWATAERVHSDRGLEVLADIAIADPELNVLDLVEGLVCVALQEVDPPNVLRWVKLLQATFPSMDEIGIKIAFDSLGKERNRRDSVFSRNNWKKNL